MMLGVETRTLELRVAAGHKLHKKRHASDAKHSITGRKSTGCVGNAQQIKPEKACKIVTDLGRSLGRRARLLLRGMRRIEKHTVSSVRWMTTKDITCHTSHITNPTSQIPHPTSHVTHPKSHITHHTSYITHHTSHITHATSHVTRHTSHITHHTSHVTHHTSHVTHHTSHITHHTSHITHHTSHITCSHIHEVLPRQT